MQIAINDTTHCRAVCDLLESLGYKSFSLSEFAVSEFGNTGVVAFADGSYTDTASAPVWGKITTLQDLLAMRDDLVRQNAKHPEELPFIDDEPRYHDGYHIRPKPRQRVYAVMGESL